jgi:hypothetical protein
MIVINKVSSTFLQASSMQKLSELKACLQRLIAEIRFLYLSSPSYPPQFSAFSLPAYYVIDLKPFSVLK